MRNSRRKKLRRKKNRKKTDPKQKRDRFKAVSLFNVHEVKGTEKMKIRATVALILTAMLLLSACGNTVPVPDDGYDIVLVTEPVENSSDPGTQSPAGTGAWQPTVVLADELFSGYGFRHQQCLESGIYRFTESNSANVKWKVYILDREFTDAERYIPQAYSCALEGNGVIRLEKGTWVYIYCPCNEWTGAEAPEGCAYSWGLDPAATAADITATVPPFAQQTQETVPVSTPAPEPTPAPTPKMLTITKHPTGESFTQGGQAWFIARADNADSITWEFLDATGAANSVEEAKAKNPGLTVDIYDGGESLCIGNVPISMNNWSARARFTGAGSTLYSNPARITVTAITDFRTAYTSVFENYLALVGGGTDTYDLATDLTLNGILLGYFLKDLDGDGTQEILFGQIGGTTGTLWDHIVYSVFTLDNGKPVKVFKSSARDRLYFTGTGFIREGSSGASESDFYSCSYAKGALTVSEGVYNTAEGYFYVTGGDRNSAAATPISSDTFNAAVVTFESSITAMTLTPIV